jgi:hypothetical protein
MHRIKETIWLTSANKSSIVWAEIVRYKSLLFIIICGPIVTMMRYSSKPMRGREIRRIQLKYTPHYDKLLHNASWDSVNASAWDSVVSFATGKPMKYHHIGIPTHTTQSGEVYLEKLKFFCTDHENNPFGIQWMRYEEGCPLPELVKTVPHVAFEVDDLQKALEGKDIIIQPNSPSPGVLVAFVVHDGAPVEFLQFLK